MTGTRDWRQDAAKVDVKVGLFLNQTVWYDGLTYSADYINLTPFFMKLGRHLGGAALCLPVCYSTTTRGRYPLEVSQTEIIPLPFWQGEGGVARQSPRLIAATARVAVRRMRDWDVVGCVSPGLVGATWTLAALLQRKPLFHLIRGNKAETLRSSYPTGVKSIFYGTGIGALDFITRVSIRLGAAAFVLGPELQTIYGGGDSERVWLFGPVLAPEFDHIFPPLAQKPVPPYRIVFIGRLSPEKGLFDLLEAMIWLEHQAVGMFSLEIAGDGPLRDQLPTRIRALGLEKHVRLVGWVSQGEELRRFYRDATMAVLPSYTEGVPLSLVEAMAFGVPVVASAVGGIPYLLRGGEAGVLVTPGQPEELGAAILHLCQDVALRSRLVMAGYERALEHTEAVQQERFIRNLQSLFPSSQTISKSQGGGRA
jgi:glycosyltransferase involved in cell wall biosynthesis